MARDRGPGRVVWWLAAVLVVAFVGTVVFSQLDRRDRGAPGYGQGFPGGSAYTVGRTERHGEAGPPGWRGREAPATTWERDATGARRVVPQEAADGPTVPGEPGAVLTSIRPPVEQGFARFAGAPVRLDEAMQVEHAQGRVLLVQSEGHRVLVLLADPAAPPLPAGAVVRVTSGRLHSLEMLPEEQLGVQGATADSDVPFFVDAAQVEVVG